jgi:hypothetical protein
LIQVRYRPKNNTADIASWAALSPGIAALKAPTECEIAHAPLKRDSLKLICLATAKGTANGKGERLLVSSKLLTVTREQYVERCKDRARSLLSVGQIREAVASMMMDMRKHPNCGVPPEINVIGISAAAAGNAAVALAYIEGFN